MNDKWVQTCALLILFNDLHNACSLNLHLSKLVKHYIPCLCMVFVQIQIKVDFEIIAFCFDFFGIGLVIFKKRILHRSLMSDN